MTTEAPRPAEPPPPIRVLTVDDHALLREGIASMLAQQPDLQVVAEAGNGREAVEAFRLHRPDVTLMDLQMPLMGGVEATLAIRAEWPHARIVALTTYKGDVQIRRALQAGVSGYLLKSMLRKELVEGIRQVHAGRRLVPSEIAAELAEHLLDEALSPREIEVLRLVAQGGSNKRVASLLTVTEDTIKAHMKGILAKLGAVDRTHAVTIALRRGIIEL
ncbi:response regulator transcription factor [Ideonella azotifigens]|uniref:Response regulator transcription factor n=1 Tax=Ideonella azotifigens TaxID=513160 RepID=A0ABN1JIN4_9BURK|nr:response regulator transcription factor [Ideonella azotifigens]MCD2342041.1 response regulator transcription factor [Ideonella azotifigens]